MHGAFDFSRAVPQRHCQNATRFQHGDQLAKGAGPLCRRNVHPDRAGEDDVKRQAKTEGRIQTGKTIAKPTDAGVRMQSARLREHAARRIDSNHLMAASRQPRCIAAAARTDVKNQCRPLRKTVE